MEADVKLYVSV